MVGAGAAGLTAARDLARRSLEVVLVEARERIGGRVLTRPVPGSVSPAELGAEFIHGPAIQTLRLLQDGGVAVVSTAGDSWVRRSGELRPDETEFAAAAALFERGRALPDQSVGDFLRRYEAEEATREAARAALAFAEGFDAADPQLAGVQGIADEWHSGVDSQSARPVGGYPRLFEQLLAECTAAGVDVRLKTPVRGIAWSAGRVRVDAGDERARTGAFDAKACVITVPIGVLRHTGDLTFTPSLPEATLGALQAIHMGHALKVVLWFTSPFWEQLNDGSFGEAAFFRSDGPFTAYWTQFPLRARVITAWAGGPRAAALETASEAELIERALDGFGSLFDETALAKREFAGGAVHLWGRDPFARGAYSYLGVGGANARAALAAPVNETLFFAGEATAGEGQGGTVNGAIVSGERAAAQVAAALRPGVARD